MMTKENLKKIPNSELIEILMILYSERDFMCSKLSVMSEVKNEERTTKSL